MPDLHHLTRNFLGPWEFNSTVHISEEFKFVFFNNPKAGCSTTKASFNLECARRIGVPLKFRSAEDIHNRGFNLLKRPSDVGAARFLKILEAPDFVRFCIVREPLSRLSSAFKSKLRRNTQHRRALNAHLGREADAGFADVNEFVETMAATPTSRDVDCHWRLQVKQICANEVQFTHIGLQERLEADLRRIARDIFGDNHFLLFDVRTFHPPNRTDSSDVKKSLSDRSRALALQLYAEDVQFYEGARRHIAHPAPAGA